VLLRAGVVAPTLHSMPQLACAPLEEQGAVIRFLVTSPLGCLGQLQQVQKKKLLGGLILVYMCPHTTPLHRCVRILCCICVSASEVAAEVAAAAAAAGAAVYYTAAGAAAAAAAVPQTTILLYMCPHATLLRLFLWVRYEGSAYKAIVLLCPPICVGHAALLYVCVCVCSYGWTSAGAARA
jgi:hypothetical protein